MKNLEIKVPAPDLPAIAALARAAGARSIATLHQTDTFYQAARSFLKLRVIRDGSSELIAYKRPRHASSRTSTYRLYPTDDPGRLKSVLDMSLTPLVEVRKSRALWRLHETRIHLDTVESLGTFVELETEAESRADVEVRAEHEEIIEALGLDRSTAIAGTYAELLLGRPLEGDEGWPAGEGA